MNTTPEHRGRTNAPTRRPRLRWLREAGTRSRATWEHIRITGQLGGYEDPDRARRTGARF